MERLREQLEGGLVFLVANAVVWFAFAASNLHLLNTPIARHIRWAALAELLLFAVAYAAANWRRQTPAASTIVAGALGGVTLLSAAWSADARLTFGRAATFCALLATGAALAYGARRRMFAPLLAALLLGAVVIAAAGVVKVIVDPNTAIVPATTGQGARYNGIGGNPDTMALLFGVVVPLAAWAAYAARSRAKRVAAWIALLLLDASIAASSSRAAVIAAFAGVLVVLVFLPLDRRARRLLVAATAAVFLLDVAAGALPPRAEKNPPLNTQFGQTPVFGPHDAAPRLPLSDEFGFPRPGHPKPTRKLFDAGGRLPAWEGAVDEAAKRPVAGYGFGMEDVVFVDRYYPFLADRPENSYLGTFLQLGLVGVALIVAFFVLVVREASVAVRTRVAEERAVAAACLGVVVAGLILALAQSYLTSVGSPATAPLWLCAFLLAAQARRPRAPTPRA